MVNMLKGQFPIPGKEKGCNIEKRKEKQESKNKIDPAYKRHHKIAQPVKKTSL